MKLSDAERLLIAATALQARAPLRLLARETGLREHTVRYALARLKERGVLTPLPIIDVSRLGLGDYAIYFSYLCPSHAERLRLRQYLIDCPDIGWAAELAGEYQYAAALYAARINAVDGFFTELSRRCPGQLLNKAVATRLSVAFFRPKFLSVKRSAVERVTCGGAIPVPIDRLDQAILRQLSRAELSSHAAVARALGLPKSTVEDRIQALEHKGVVRGYGMQFNTQSAGISSFRLMLYEKRPNALTADLLEYAAASPYVTCCLHCVGNWDYELSVRVPEPNVLPELVQDIYTRFGSELSGLRVLTVLQRMKYCMFPFAEEIAL